MLSTQPISVMLNSSPELSLPAPVQNKHNVHRISAVVPCELKTEQDSEFPKSDLEMEPSLPVQAPSHLVVKSRMSGYPCVSSESMDS